LSKGKSRMVSVRWLVPVLIVGNVLTLPVQLLQSDLETRILQLRDARHRKELRGS
jgi:hypothetical protein